MQDLFGNEIVEKKKSKNIFAYAKETIIEKGFSDKVVSEYMNYLSSYTANRGLKTRKNIDSMINSLVNLRDIEKYEEWALIESIQNSKGKNYGSFYTISNYENKNFIKNRDKYTNEVKTIEIVAKERKRKVF